MAATEIFPVLEGGRGALSARQRAALGRLAVSVRALPDDEAERAAGLVEELSREGRLAGLRELDFGVLAILAEVLREWEPDGVYEFGRAWISTLVARRDGFSWDRATAAERGAHRERIQTEVRRRGL